jgi:hypothetical protein
MKRRLLILCLCLPIGLLVSVVIRHVYFEHGNSAPVWFKQMKVGRPSTGLDTLKKMGPAAVPVLQRALKSQKRYQRFRAAWALGQLGPAAENAIPDLVNALNDADLSVRIYSIQALTKIGTSREDLIPKLLVMLKHKTLSNYAACLLNEIERQRNLQNLDPIPSDDFEYAMAFAHSPIPSIRVMGAQKLAALDRKVKVTEALQLCLNDRNGWVRQETLKLISAQNHGAKPVNSFN